VTGPVAGDGMRGTALIVAGRACHEHRRAAQPVRQPCDATNGEHATAPLRLRPYRNPCQGGLD